MLEAQAFVQIADGVAEEVKEAEPDGPFGELNQDDLILGTPRWVADARQRYADDALLFGGESFSESHPLQKQQIEAKLDTGSSLIKREYGCEEPVCFFIGATDDQESVEAAVCQNALLLKLRRDRFLESYETAKTLAFFNVEDNEQDLFDQSEMDEQVSTNG